LDSKGEGAEDENFEVENIENVPGAEEEIPF
jgi:hypothetical protein